MKKNIYLLNTGFSLFVLFILLNTFSCRKESCEYLETTDNNANSDCNLTNSLNLSTGIDAAGNLIAPGKGVIDPFWKLLNNPPLIACTSPLLPSINGSAYVVNFLNVGNTGWVNQPTASTLAPLNLGTTDSFGCNNATNSIAENVPYVFDRSFCVLKNTSVDFNFTFKGDDRIFFQLINNTTNTVVKTSATYVFPAATASWVETGIPLSIGSYSIRAYLVNTSSVVLGFSFTGVFQTSNGDLAISNNVNGCCENNTISILNIEESNCNGIFDGADKVGQNWTFNVKNSSGTIIKTGTTDVNGNIFFTGLANGTYTIEIVPKSGWISNNPTGGSTTVTLSNNNVSIKNFYNCP